MQQVEGAGVQHLHSPFSSPFFGVELFYDYGFSSVWVLPVIPLFLTNTVVPVRACLSSDGRGFVWTKKKASMGLLVFNPLWGTRWTKWRKLFITRANAESWESRCLAPSKQFPPIPCFFHQVNAEPHVFRDSIHSSIEYKSTEPLLNRAGHGSENTLDRT